MSQRRVDIAHWAMDTELSGPVDVSATAELPKKGLWDVHGPYHVCAAYANGATVYMSEKYPNGLRFIGEDAWIWVWRANNVPGRPSGSLPGPDRRRSTPAIAGSSRPASRTARSIYMPVRRTITTWTGSPASAPARSPQPRRKWVTARAAPA